MFVVNINSFPLQPGSQATLKRWRGGVSFTSLKSQYDSPSGEKKIFNKETVQKDIPQNTLHVYYPPPKKNNKNELTCFFNYCFLGFVETTFVMVSVCNSEWISVHAHEHVIPWKRFRWWYFSQHIPRCFVNWVDAGVLSPGIRQWFCEHLFFLRHCLPRSLRNDSCAVP